MATTRTYAVGFAGKVIRQDSLVGAWTDITPSFPNEEETTWFDVMTDPLDPDKVTIVGDANLSNNIGSGILVSTDAGVNWNIPAGNWGSIAGIDQLVYKEVWYADSNVIWAISNGGIVVTSTDAGLTFNRVTPIDKTATAQGACIHAIDSNIAIVGGTPFPAGLTAATTYVWITVNAGLTWQILNGGATLFNSGNPIGEAEGIWISDDQQRIIVGTTYAQMLSTDGGATFNPTNAPMTRSGRHLTWYPAHDANPTTMRHVGGSPLHVNESTDNGSTWTIVRQVEGITIIGAHFYDTDDGYYVTQDGNVYSTNDGAITGTVSYTSGTLFTTTEFNAVWTTEDPPGSAGCPCYLATNCEDSNDQVSITFDCADPSFVPLVPGTIYQFSSPDYMVDKCWTVIEEDCPDQIVVDLSTGVIDDQGTLGTLYDDLDFNWEVVGVPPAGLSNTFTPFSARIGNQTWFGGYGAIPGALWITAGQLDGSATCPGGIPGCQALAAGPGAPIEHDRSPGLTTYELTFNAPINFVPLLNLTFIIDNTSPNITLNGNPLSYTPPATPWTTPTLVTTSNPAFFNTGVNVLRITVNNLGNGSNGFAMGGTIENQNPPSVTAIVSNEWVDCVTCLDPTVPNICWDLEVLCDGICPDVYAVNNFDFTPFIGQNISIQPPLSTDPECLYTPYALRQALFAATVQAQGGGVHPTSQIGYNITWPFGAFQQGTDDITVSIPSFILNGVEQIAGSPPNYLLTPANIQFVLCSQMLCNNVPLNNPGQWTGYANTVDFINTTLSSLGILTMQAYNNSPDNCPVEMQDPYQTDDTFRIQYRDGDTFTFTIQFSDTAHGISTAIYQVQGSNVTISYVNSVGNPQIDLPVCNDNIYCPTLSGPTIIGATIEGPCPMPPLGEACDIKPRLGEPGFSVKNCDPKKVIDIKCKFGDSVYAQFKRARYGIDTCCEFDLDKIDIKNQLIDLGAIYDPDLCIDGTPLPEDCCLQPCDAVANLIVPNFISCPAPTGPVIIDLTIPSPPFVSCIEATLTVNLSGDPTILPLVTGTDCCGDIIDLIVPPDNLGGVKGVTLCVDVTQPYTVASNITVTLTGVDCGCCPAPTGLDGVALVRTTVSIP